jgi:hypothetical protein
MCPESLAAPLETSPQMLGLGPNPARKLTLIPATIGLLDEPDTYAFLIAVKPDL